MFEPYNDRDPSFDDDTYTIDQEVGTRPQPAYQTPDMENSAADDYAQHINQMPMREEVSNKRKLLAAIIAGLSAAGGEGIGNSVALGSSVRDDEYNQGIHDWSQKGKQLENLANISYRSLNAKARDAAIRNKHISDIGELEFKYDDAERKRQKDSAQEEALAKNRRIIDENADLDRKERAGYHSGMVGASQRRAKASETNANRPRTGNQGKPSPVYKSYTEAKDAAFDAVLAESPAFEDFVEVGEGGASVRRDRQGKPVKRWVDDKGQIHLIPMTAADLKIVQDFNTKVRQKSQEFTNKVRNYNPEIRNYNPAELEEEEE
jgi:hypothetical protein